MATATWTADPSFYPSPRMAMKAAPETLAYVATFDPDRKTLSGTEELVRFIARPERAHLLEEFAPP